MQPFKDADGGLRWASSAILRRRRTSDGARAEPSGRREDADDDDTNRRNAVDRGRVLESLVRSPVTVAH